MKKAYFRYFFSSIRRDFSRIASIIAIVALGVGFLIGLISSAPDLYAGVNRYMKKVNYQDINIKSSVGFSERTVAYLHENLEDIAVFSAVKETESAVKAGNVSYYAKFIEQPTEVHLVLKEGRFPESKNECVVLSDNPTLTDDPDEMTVESGGFSYRVVGKVVDPTYIIKEDITSSLNSKKFQIVAYLDSSFDNDRVENAAITDLWLKVGSLNELNVFSSKYEKKVDEKISEIEDFCEANDLIAKNYRYVLEEQIVSSALETLKDQGYDEEALFQIQQSEAFLNQIASAVEEEFVATYDASNPSFYYLDHHSVPALETFIVNAEKVNLVARIFPVFFFAIAVLVSLSSFGRIVAKDRMEIATLKANGYSSGKIYEKYLLLGFFSTLIGCVFGVLGGVFLLPYIIYQMYYTLCAMPPIVFTFQSLYIFGISILMIAAILLVIYFVVSGYNRKSISALMLGRDNGSGKKIVLERIPFLWKRLKFKYKSMFRNIFRFKKNLFMMILGVGGCSAILLAGFGLSDSINVLTKTQYREIFKYNLIVETDSPKIDSIDEQIEILYYGSGHIEGDEKYDLTLIAGGDALNEYVCFTSAKGKSLTFDADSCFLTKQVAEALHVSAGKECTFVFQNRECTLKVDQIVENYVGNYLYVGENRFDFDGWENGHAILGYKDFSGIDENEWLDELSLSHEIRSVVFTEQYFQVYNSLVENLRGIVLLLVLISGILAIIVIYTLVDINLNERVKEMATLRVLGYQKREVVMYLFREIFVMSVLGFGFGIFFGVYLHRFVIAAICSPGLIFGIRINPLSYLYSGLLTVLFSLIVVVVFSPKILKINMSEALKSSE